MRRRKGCLSYLKKQQKNEDKNGEKEPTLEGDRRQCGRKILKRRLLMMLVSIRKYEHLEVKIFPKLVTEYLIHFSSA